MKSIKGMSKRGKSGFTLVEIMVTVGIVGCLAGIAIPNFIKARSHGHRNVCIANLKQIDDAKITWGMENKKPADAEHENEDLYGAAKYLREEPICPSKGTYSLGTVEGKVTCSQAAAEGHTL